jgi:predicted permease
MQARAFATLVRDLRQGARQLRNSPSFTVVAILTLALGIGANAAIFTLVHAVLIKSLPVSHPTELYSLGDTRICCDTTDVQENFALYSYPLYREVRDQAREFSEVAAFQSWLTNLSVRRASGGLAQPYRGQFVSGNYFSMFGVGAFAGRTLTADDDEPNAAPVAVMSFRAWKQNFGKDRSVVGAVFNLNGSPITVVGIAAPEFFGDTLRSDPPAFWLPLALEPALDNDNPLLHQPSEFWLYAVGRLRPGIQPAALDARLTLQVKQWLTGHTTLRREGIENVRVRVLPAGNGVGRLRDTYGDGLRLLAALSGLVLLIACGNIANLLLARSTAHRSQTSVRIALGASRARIVGQMLTEGLLLATLGGAAGIALAFALTRGLIMLAFRGADYVPIDATPSLPVVAFTLLISLLTGVIFSAVPAWLAGGTHPVEAMQGAGRSTRNRSALPQKLLVVVQAALSLVLLVGAGLLGQSLRNLQNQQFGFQTQGRLIVRLNPALAGYTPDRLPALYRTLKERFTGLPGVLRASLALHSPMDGWNWNTPVYIAGRTPAVNPDDDAAQYDFVSADYFDVIGTRLMLGRLITEQDQPNTRHVCVVNQAFVRKFFGRENPVGRHLGLNGISHSGDYEIVGIVEDAKYRDPKAPAEAMFFMPLLQLVKYEQPTDNAYQIWGNYIDGVQLQVAGSPENFESAVRQTLAQINPNLTVLRLTTFDGQISGSFNSPRLVAQLTTIYGLVALALAAVGLYGVASYTVARRTSEIGIRMALGAQRSTVLVLVLRVALTPIALGLAIGVPVILAGGRGIASQLYGVRSWDPFVLAGAAAVLGLTAVLAALIPARRAASIDPIRALRTD